MYLKATAPQQQRAQRRAQQPAYASPEIVKTKLDRTSAEVKRNYRSGPLYPEATFGKQLDDVVGGKPLDDTTKEIIRRLGVTPLEYFTQQNDKHAPGKPLPAPVLEKLKELDKVSLALPVSGGGSMGLGMITPNMARAQRLWNAIQPRQNSQTTMPNSTAPIASSNAGVKLRGAIIGNESGGDYNIVNPDSGAIGIGQVMPANVPSWTAKFYGRQLTPAQFRNNKAAQDAVVNGQLQEYYDQEIKAGYPQNIAVRRAASTWYSGQARLYDSNKAETYNGRRYPSIREYTTDILNRFLRGN